MKLHRTKVIPSARKRGFPTELPNDASVEYIEEKSGGSPVYVYYTVPE
jgi:hypothetical protein